MVMVKKTVKKSKSCTIYWKKGEDGQYYVRIPRRGYVLGFPSYKALRKAIKPGCRTKRMKGKV